MSFSSSPLQRSRVGIPVQHAFSGKFIWTGTAENEYMISRRIKLSSGLKYDQCSIESSRELRLIVHVRVVDKSSSSRRCEASTKGTLRLNCRSDVGTIAAPPDHTVVVALQFHAVPVNRGRFRNMIHHRNFRRAAALEDHRWSGCTRHCCRIASRFLQLITESRRYTVLCSTLAHYEPKLSNRAMNSDWVALPRYRDSHDQPGHVIHAMFMQSLRARTERISHCHFRPKVRRQMTVEEPLPGGRHKERRHSLARIQRLRHHRAPLFRSEDAVLVSVTHAVNAVITPVQVHWM